MDKEDSFDWDLSANLAMKDVAPSTLVEIYSEHSLTVESTSPSEENLRTREINSEEDKRNVGYFGSDFRFPEKTDLGDKKDLTAKLKEEFFGLKSSPVYDKIRESNLFEKLVLDINIYLLDSKNVDIFTNKEKTVEVEQIPTLVDPIINIILDKATCFIHDYSRSCMSTEYEIKLLETVDTIVNDVVERSKLTAFLWEFHDFKEEFHHCKYAKPSECLHHSPPSCSSPTCEEQWNEILRIVPQVETLTDPVRLSKYFNVSSYETMEPCPESLISCGRQSYARSFTDQMAKEIVEDFISNWELPRPWVYDIALESNANGENSRYWKYSVKCSKPTVVNSIPCDAAKVCLKLEVFKTYPPEVPHEISYTVEGCGAVRTENIKIEWLEDVLYRKAGLRHISEAIRALGKSE